MARQEIILGTPPAGLGGDPPRTASMKINAMTQELYDKHAALGTASVRAAQTTSKAYSGELLRADLNGIGMMSVLEGTVYANGVPADLFGTGFCEGFCSGGALGIPGMTTGNYGVLTSKMHWNDAGGGASNIQEWRGGQVKYVRYPLSNTAWTAWILVSAQLVGISGNGLNQSVIERGSNAGGDYVRFIDGTMFTWGSRFVANVNTPAGGAINTNVAGLQPAVFAGNAQHSVSVTFYTSVDGGGVGIYGSIQNYTSIGSPVMQFIALNTGQSPNNVNPSFTIGNLVANSHYITFQSTGRWK